MDKGLSGLKITNVGANVVDISPSARFLSSIIYIEGSGNTVRIGDCRIIDGMSICFVGNNKLFSLGSSNKKVKKLKIVSRRGNSQIIKIGEQFGCGGLEVQMNDGDERLTIGDDCLFSWGIKIRTSDGHSIVDLTSGLAVNLPQDVVVGDHVWVGEDVKFLKGAEIPSSCIVGSGSIVTRNFSDENSIVAGVPARVVKRGVTWHREMPVVFNKRNGL